VARVRSLRLVACACAWLTCTLAAGCSNDHTGVPATAPFDPIGSEPTSGAAGAGAGILGLLCAQACANIAAACPGQLQDQNCMPQCTNDLNNYRGCEAQELAYISCLAMTQLDCVYGFYRAPACDPAFQTITDCISALPPTPQ
jgi:hypothetical protein